MLTFGDSITQGYDVLRPSHRYVAKLAEVLDAEEINKAIGGEVFFAELARLRDNIEPDYVVVAYGTNDWSKTEQSDFSKRCFDFYEALCQNYPEAKIYALTPVWRKDYQEVKVFGSFNKVREIIQNVVENFENVTYVCGYNFIPHDEKYFADLRLHPNDEGFEQYTHNLVGRIAEDLLKSQKTTCKPS